MFGAIKRRSASCARRSLLIDSVSKVAASGVNLRADRVNHALTVPTNISANIRVVSGKRVDAHRVIRGSIKKNASKLAVLLKRRYVYRAHKFRQDNIAKDSNASGILKGGAQPDRNR